MRILQINKYLFRRGGSETMMMLQAEGLAQAGHEVDFWGMYHPKNEVGGGPDVLPPFIDYGDIEPGRRVFAGLRSIYSPANRRSMEQFLSTRHYDVAHLHNFNYQLTPSILAPLRKRGVKIIYSAHDSQLACPYHRLYNFREDAVCTRCVEGSFLNCVRTRCVGDSRTRSMLAALESWVYHQLRVYERSIDLIIAPSGFLKSIIEKRVKTPIVVLPNFAPMAPRQAQKKDYVVFFGRVSREKGVLELARLFTELKIPLRVIGSGPDAELLEQNDYVSYLGPRYGDELFDEIRQARFVIQPSKWYENCPMTVIESIACGTPVIAPDHSGFRELVIDGYNGYLLNFGNGGLRKRIREVYDSYSPTLADNCIEDAQKRFSREAYFSRFVPLFTDLAAN